jgi:electron transfer flavoprotein-quinone oxidoreductase
VDDLLLRDGRVAGIIAGGEEMEAAVVIIAEGVNSLLTEKAGLRAPLAPHQVAVSAKEVIELSEDAVNQRFGLDTGEGLAWLFAGSATSGRVGGGFLYTNTDSVSLGVVCTLSDLDGACGTLPQMLDELKSHVALRTYLAGGRTVEYSGHMVPEAGISMVPRLSQDGVLVVGDAAGLALNLGYQVRGMDLAIESGRLAGEAAIAAHARESYQASTLSAYDKALESSFVLKEMRHYRKFPAFMEGTPRIYNEYPRLVCGILEDMFTVDGSVPEPMKKMVQRHVRELGLLTLARDAIKGVGAL